MTLSRSGVFLALFAAVVVSAWAWFHVWPPSEPRLPDLTASTNLTGFEFHFEPLSETASAMLATPDYVNGAFSATTENSTTPKVVRVFSASWPATRTIGLNVIQHTPDICWVGSGWVPIDLGQPDQVELDFMSPGLSPNTALTNRIRLRFECRAFSSPDARAKELVMWCTLVGGHVLPESSRFRASKKTVSGPDAGHDRERQFAAGRRLSADYFIQSVQRRLRVQGAKQFVRISTTVEGDCAASLEELQGFARRWLTVASNSP